ncbi:unnamed protein product [Aphanomyces euteiches]
MFGDMPWLDALIIHDDKPSPNKRASPQSSVRSGKHTTHHVDSNPHRKRQRDELLYLRDKVSDLEAQLTRLKKKHEAALADPSPWRHLAIQMRHEKDVAVVNNQVIRAALQEQIEFGHALHAILVERPRVAMIPMLDEVSIPSRLPADPTFRFQAAMDISAHQYSMLHSAFVSGDLIDCTTEFQTCVPKLWHDNMLVVEAAACRQAPVDQAIVARMVWAITTGQLRDSLQPLERLEEFTPDLAYVNIPIAFVGLAGQNRDLVRRYSEPNRDVFVYRSILEDELKPHDKAMIANESAWLVVEPIDPSQGGGGGCRVKFFMRLTPPLLSRQTKLDVKTTIDGLIHHSTTIMHDFEMTIQQLL